MLNSVTTAGETQDYWSSVTVSEVTVHTHMWRTEKQEKMKRQRITEALVHFL